MVVTWTTRYNGLEEGKARPYVKFAQLDVVTNVIFYSIPVLSLELHH
jgi:hypothetical protein